MRLELTTLVLLLGILGSFPGGCHGLWFDELDIDCCEVACYLSQRLCDHFCADEYLGSEEDYGEYDDDDDEGDEVIDVDPITEGEQVVLADESS